MNELVSLVEVHFHLLQNIERRSFVYSVRCCFLSHTLQWYLCPPSYHAYQWLFYNPVLSAIAKVNKAIEVGDPQAVTASVLDKHAHIMSADESFGDKYVQELAAVKRQKAEVRHWILQPPYLMLTPPMLRLLLSKAHKCCHVGVH